MNEVFSIEQERLHLIVRISTHPYIGRKDSKLQKAYSEQEWLK